MTNTAPSAPAIVAVILDLDGDLLQLMLDAADALPPLANELLLSLDICPMHRCDAAICADDDVIECEALRG